MLSFFQSLPSALINAQGSLSQGIAIAYFEASFSNSHINKSDVLSSREHIVYDAIGFGCALLRAFFQDQL
jgi:hypothetical protein